jgi:hypothetical protein
MDNRMLLEDIKRMHKLIGITPNILIESVITEGVVDKEAVAVFKSIFTNIERAVVAGGKSYTKNQVKQVIGKIGSVQLSNEEKVLVQTLTRDAIALDKTLMKRLSNEVFGEMQKLPNRRLKTAHYGRVKRGLKEVLPKEEFNALISNVNAKLNIQPKPAPNPNPAPNPAPNPNTGQGGNNPFVDTTDDELLNMLKKEFDAYDIDYKLNPKQEQFFLNQVKPKIHELYKIEEPKLATAYRKLADRYEKIDTKARIELLEQSQKIILDLGIGLNIPEKVLFKLNEYIKLSLKKNKEEGLKFFLFNLKILAASAFFDVLATKIKTGELGFSNNLFGLSWEKNTGLKGIIAIVGQFFMGLPGQILSVSQLALSVVDFGTAFPMKDAKEQLGDSPISIQDAKDFVEDETNNPLGLDFNVDKIIYIPFSVKGEEIKGEKGATIKVYTVDQVTNEKTEQAILKKDFLTKKVSRKTN